MNTNGVLSFNVSFTSPDGQVLNFSDVISPPIIAPFWDDTDIRTWRIYGSQGAGSISYRVVSDERF